MLPQHPHRAANLSVEKERILQGILITEARSLSLSS